MSDNGVFISYRRGTGSEVARIMQEYLEGQGFDVFLDVDGLGAGHFDEQLLREIESRRNFVLICSPGCLDRCVHEGDWVRRELEYAIRTGRHIVPVTMPQFVWPTGDVVPRVVKELQRHNAFEYSHSHWALTKQKLASMLGRPSRSKRRASATEPGEQSVMRRYGVWVAAGAVSVLAMLLWASLGGNSDRQSGTRSEWPEDLAGGGAGEKAVVQAPAAQEAAVRRGWNGDWDVEVLREEPDPAVVTDAAARARMIATKLPWKVRDEKSGIVMLLCPPGEFMMGSPASESGRETDETHHRRTIGTAFYLGETEVTQEQWQRVMAENPSYFKGASSPVEQVSWDDCKRFCASTRFRLPTEAEWEYGCRAGTTGAYAGDLASMAWFGDNSGRVALNAKSLWARDQSLYAKAMSDSGCQSHPVRLRRANAWGFFDMHGNVWEWCEDGYGDYPRGTAKQDPARTAEAGPRVLRGGSWFYFEHGCRSAHRNYGDANDANSSIGFRVARTHG
jgi:formylglycine-generating enzyme required for sulfatase activity